METFKKKLYNTTNSYKLFSAEIDNYSTIIRKSQYEIHSLVINYYNNFLKSFILNTDKYLDNIIKSIIDIDISCCNANNAVEYCYYKPTIDLIFPT